MIGDYIWLNGALLPRDEARVSVLDHNFVYGDGAFEGLQVVSGGIFKLERHIDRLYDSARYLAIDIGMPRARFIEAVLETARRNRMHDGYLRPVVSRGAGPVGIRHMDRLGPATVVIIAQHEEAGRAHALDRGLKAQVVSLRRVPSQSVDARVKSCNYINNVLAYLEAKHAGADTAIMLDIAGNVAEGYGGNIFTVRRGRIATPALGDILEGVTRETVLDLCRESAIPAEETRLTVYDLLAADEVFETATLAELSPITAINGRAIGTGKVGPVVRQLHAALRKLMVEGRMSTPVFPS